MLRLIRASLAQMLAEESALVINTSASHALMEAAARKISRRQAAKMIAFSASGDDLLQRLDFLEHVIQTKHVRLLVITSFEFAACFSRQRNKLVHWLRRMRDDHDVRIVVYSLERNAPQMGPLGLLAWTADLVRELHNSNTQRDFTETPNANQTIIDYLESVEPLPSFRAQREIPSVSVDSASQPPNPNAVISTEPSSPREEARGEIPSFSAESPSHLESPEPQTQSSVLSPDHSPTRGLAREFAQYQAARQLAKAAARMGNAPLKNKELQPQEVLA